MGRAKNLVPSVQLNVWLPKTLVDKVNAELFSEVEQRIPFGAQQRFYQDLLLEYFESDSLDLAPWMGVPSGFFVVRGTKAVIEDLRCLLLKLEKGAENGNGKM